LLDSFLAMSVLQLAGLTSSDNSPTAYRSFSVMRNFAASECNHECNQQSGTQRARVSRRTIIPNIAGR
jgi:hypothetical protein